MTKITIEATVSVPVATVWKFWTEPKHVENWNSPSPDWHTPKAENDLKVGGRFNYRMEAKDKSFGFDFSGVYTKVEPEKAIDYTLDDNRTVQNTFSKKGDGTHIKVVFEAESENPVEMQQQGWQAILNNFKHYTESKN